jgi:hypothetical protein
VLLLRVATLLKRHMPIRLTPIEYRRTRPFPLWTRGRALPAEGLATAKDSASLVLCESGARPKSLFGGNTCPLQGRAERPCLRLFRPCPGLTSWEVGLRPQASTQTRQARRGSIRPRWGAVAAGQRLGPGSPAWLVVGGPTSCATGCALDALAPPSVGGGS